LGSDLPGYRGGVNVDQTSATDSVLVLALGGEPETIGDRAMELLQAGLK
jgi:hypothetical protein